MRIFLFLFFSFTLVSGAFAQFTWQVTCDMNMRLVSWMLPTGEKAEKLINIGNRTWYNNAANNPTTANRGDYTFSSGTMDLFSYDRIYHHF